MHSGLSDSELLEIAGSGNKGALEAVIRRHLFLVKSRARSYFLAGADYDDLIQEGMIGLMKASMTYDDGYGTSFHSFADLCINRQMMMAIKAANRLKHNPLNTYISIDCSADEAENPLSITDATFDPVDHVLGVECLDRFQKAIRGALSELELKVFREFSNGKSYTEIAKSVDRSPKAVDNALQRAKQKLAGYIEAN